MAKKTVTPAKPAKPVNPAKPAKAMATAPAPQFVSVMTGKRNISIDVRFMVDFLVQLLRTPSPTGYTADALHLVRETLAALKLDTRFNTKGGLIATWQGKANTHGRALTAHVDTLGAMVKEIDSATGRLRLSKIGGLTWNSVEGETCSIITNAGRVYRGTVLPRRASVHVHSGPEVERGERSDATMELRLDAKVRSGAEIRQLGIEVGDFVAFDPRTEVTNTGFIRSRHLDDKASVACIVTACKALLDAGLRPTQRITVLISHYEEVGHGAATGIPADAKEVLAIDLAAVGPGQNSDEYSVGICVKDSGGPYSLEMKQLLMRLCENADIPYKLDIYPYYGSDVGTVWRSGADVLGGLIGPGVDASHHYERTHVDSLIATVRLIIEFMLA
jgi:putative aminopeptidase FrvX